MLECENKTSLVLCPKCGSECGETWIVMTKKGKYRVRPKRVSVVCRKCRYNLATVKQPIQLKQ